MKRIAAILVLVTASLFVQAQNQMDFFSFVESFDWSLTRSQFKAKYSDRIRSSMESMPPSSTLKNRNCFVLNDMRIGTHDCIAIIIYENYKTPLIFAHPSQEEMLIYQPSTLCARLDYLTTERYGDADSMWSELDLAAEDFDWIGISKGTFKLWMEDHYTLAMVSSTNPDDILPVVFMVAKDVSVKPKERPAIQDSFFGIKIGSFTNESDIIAAVGIKGKYLKELRDANSILYVFSDMFFAGYKWDYCSFVCGPDGRLCMFRAIRTFTSKDYNYVDKANDLYNSVKQKLDAKYGEGKKMKAGRNNSITSYSGSNDMVLILQNKWEPSQSGPYYKRVGIEYSNTVIYNQLKQAGNDEL